MGRCYLRQRGLFGVLCEASCTYTWRFSHKSEGEVAAGIPDVAPCYEIVYGGVIEFELRNKVMAMFRFDEGFVNLFPVIGGDPFVIQNEHGPATFVWSVFDGMSLGSFDAGDCICDNVEFLFVGSFSWWLVTIVCPLTHSGVLWMVECLRVCLMARMRSISGSSILVGL